MCGTAKWFPDRNEAYFAALKALTTEALKEQLSYYNLSYRSTLLVPSFDKLDLEQEITDRNLSC